MGDLVKDVYTAINSRLLLSRYQTLGALAGLASNEPTLVLGEPGSGKSMLVETIAAVLGKKWRYYMVSEFTDPDELLGPVDLRAYKNEGKFKRVIKNSILDPSIAIIMIDEIFRSSSAVRNALLDIILNKRFFNWDEEIKFNGRIFFASNFISDDPKDKAFIDRITLFVFMESEPLGMIEDEIAYRMGVLYRTALKPPRIPTHTLSELVALENEINEMYSDVIKRLQKQIALSVAEVEGIFNRKLSNRRFVKLVRVGCALRLITQRLLGKYFSYRSKKDEAEDLIKSASIYVLPQDKEELFGVYTHEGRETTRFALLTSQAPIELPSGTPESISELVKQIDKAIESIKVESARNVREYIGTLVSTATVLKVLESALNKYISTMKPANEDEIYRAFNELKLAIFTGRPYGRQLKKLVEALGIG